MICRIPCYNWQDKKKLLPQFPMSHPKRSSRGRTPETTKILVFNLGIFVRFSGDLLSQITISRQRMLDTVQNIADAWPSDIYIYIIIIIIIVIIIITIFIIVIVVIIFVILFFLYMHIHNICMYIYIFIWLPWFYHRVRWG